MISLSASSSSGDVNDLLPNTYEFWEALSSLQEEPMVLKFNIGFFSTATFPTIVNQWSIYSSRFIDYSN